MLTRRILKNIDTENYGKFPEKQSWCRSFLINSHAVFYRPAKKKLARIFFDGIFYNFQSHYSVELLRTDVSAYHIAITCLIY